LYQSAKSPNDLAHLLGASSLLQFRVDSLHNIPPNCSRLISFVSAAHCEVLSGGPQRCPIEAIRLILEEKLELGLQHKDFSSATDPLSNLWTPLPSQESLINALVKQGLTLFPDPFRSVAASSALARGAPVDEVLQMGDWSCESTFWRYHSSL
jgi:hypothetical protein